MPYVFTFLRRFSPITRLGGIYLTSRYDDLREVFATDGAFCVPYKPRLDVIMGGQPFFLGMGDTPQYRHDTDAMRTALTGFIVGGPPQPPMVVPQALEQLLRRPEALAGAQAAARADDDAAGDT
ncbi:hypothetical protein [Sphingomonas sp.]|jgi:hypothetical protein|uniref:hypothetical protein n=1 Tax=Sphingomonas sp. TaxID=28214 RepID=UPI002EDB66E1